MNPSNTQAPNNVETLITDNLDIWAGAIKKRGSQGRGSSKKIELYGIKKLRELILDLAVRGLLVPQDPNDEPASVLLEKIAAEKESLINNGKIKKQKKLPEISNDEKLGRKPTGWEYCRLSDAYDVRDGTHDSPKYQPSGFPLVTSKNISSGKLDLSDVKYISESDHLKIQERSRVDVGDILFAMIGSIGSPVIVDVKPDFSIKNVALFKYYLDEYSLPSFLNIYLKFAENIFKKEASGAVQSFVSLGKIRSFVILVPPLSEQHRIVAKVDELMALCDQLEQQTENSIAHHQTLVETLLDALTNTLATRNENGANALTAKDGGNSGIARLQDVGDRAASGTSSRGANSLTAKDGGNSGIARLQDVGDRAASGTSSRGANSFQQAWQRIADNFDVLFTTEQAIEKLKQTILQLAVMGKLVPQDPNDEPASVLLEKIAAEKAQLIKDGKIKKQKPLPPISEDEKPFELPVGWEFLRLGALGYDLGGGTPSKGKNEYWNGSIPWVSPKDMKLDFVESSQDLITELATMESTTKLIPAGSILIVVRGMILAHSFPVAVNNIPVTINQDMKALVISSIDKVFLLYVLKGLKHEFVSLVDRSSHGTCKLISEKLWSKVLAVPPIEEQHRIVTKIDELMALCDQLKFQISEAQTIQLHLTDELAKADMS